MTKKNIFIIGGIGIILGILLMYYIKDRLGIDILPHRHMLFFKEQGR